MKKLYTLAFMATAAFSFGQSVVITRIVDGTLSANGCTATGGGTSSPKIVELYVSGTADLSYYRIQTEANGAADEAAISWNAGTYLTALGTVTDSFVYLVYAQSGETLPVFTEMYPEITTNIITSSNVPNMNGNDALRVVLFDAPAPDGNMVSVIDQVGNPLQIANGDDFSAPWAYQDSYVLRNDEVGANGGDFSIEDFTFGGNAAFATPNNTCDFIAAAITLGEFEPATASLVTEEIAGLKLFPNPLAAGSSLNITSNNGEEKSVAIYDVLGKQVFAGTTNRGTVNTTDLKAGIYIVKITEGNKTATRKLIVQ